MRECSHCGEVCDSQIGVVRELRTEFWGGKRNGNVQYSPKIVTFFCSEEHRMAFLETGLPGGEVQTDKWERDDEE